MSKEDDVKKLMNLLEGKSSGTGKSAKDIRESILNKISSEPSNDIKKEYFRRVDNSRLLKTAIIYCIYNKDLQDNELKTEGKRLVQKLTSELNENMSSPRPTISTDGQNYKYRFKDGSESTLENYAPIKETVFENQLLNKINKLENLCSDALGYIIRIEKQLWHRDDGIEEIDFTEDWMEKNERDFTNGR